MKIIEIEPKKEKELRVDWEYFLGLVMKREDLGSSPSTSGLSTVNPISALGTNHPAVGIKRRHAPLP